MARYPYPGGAFEQHAGTAPICWTETKTGGGALFSFEEARRDAEHIVLHDGGRGFTIRLPLKGGLSTLSTDGGCFGHMNRLSLTAGLLKRFGYRAEQLGIPFAHRSVQRYDAGTMEGPQHPQEGRQVGAAAAFVEARMALGHAAFSLEELTQETGLSAIAARFQLLRLRSKVARVSPRQPFFLIVSPEHRNLGAPPPTWWLHDYFSWLGRPYYLALQSAASTYGSNPQALQVTQVMTDRPLRPIKVGRTHLRFFVKRGIKRTPAQQPEGAVAPLLISTPEATVYDLVRYATSIGGIERAAETIRPLLPQLRTRELKRVLDAETGPAVAQRLGFVVEVCGNKPLANVVRDCLPSQLTPVALVPGRGQRDNLPLVKRWQVLNNSGELKV